MGVILRARDAMARLKVSPAPPRPRSMVTMKHVKIGSSIRVGEDVFNSWLAEHTNEGTNA